jgi:hypothetical protein
MSTERKTHSLKGLSDLFYMNPTSELADEKSGRMSALMAHKRNSFASNAKLFN